MNAARATAGLLALAGAIWMLGPDLATLREFASWFARPARLPFAWQARNAALQQGDGNEAFARGLQIVQLIPRWVAGHIAFAYQFVLDDDRLRADPEQAAAAAERRLDIGLACLEAARADAGDGEYHLVEAAAFLPQVACNTFEGLAERLVGRGGAAGIADRYLQEAERLRPLPETFEMRLFFTPRLVAALLDAGARAEALRTIDAALARVPEVRDQQQGREWASRMREVRAALSGEPGVDLSAVFADHRFEPLHPFLR